MLIKGKDAGKRIKILKKTITLIFLSNLQKVSRILQIKSKISLLLFVIASHIK